MRSNISTQGHGAAVRNGEVELSKNRLEFQTVDRLGNTLSSEGADPSEGKTTGDIPNHPVKIGDSWKSTHEDQRGDTEITNTLEELTEIRGKKFAIVEYATKSRISSTTGKRWIDLVTGIIAKGVESGTTKSHDGVALDVTSEGWFVDAEGNRWIE